LALIERFVRRRSMTDLARWRLQQQGLVAPCCGEPQEVVEHLLAVQSQDFPGAKWAIAQRTPEPSDAAVQRAFDDGAILRTHVLRPTWHFVAPRDIRWLLELTAPRVHAANAYYYRQHGMDAALIRRSNERIVEALAGGRHSTRQELGRELEALGRPTGNRLAYFIMHAELDGLIVSGAMRGKQHTYALLDERAPAVPRLARDEALAELARRYISGHGPACSADLAWWSGLTRADAKRGLEAAAEHLGRMSLDGETYWFAPPPPSLRWRRPRVHLLPSYDELSIAFAARTAKLDPNVNSKGDALSAHLVTVDGRIVGGWRRTISRREVVIVAQLSRPLGAVERRGLEQAAERYAASLGLGWRRVVERRR
jgi:winged helix DNA-binding protein